MGGNSPKNKWQLGQSLAGFGFNVWLSVSSPVSPCWLMEIPGRGSKYINNYITSRETFLSAMRKTSEKTPLFRKEIRWRGRAEGQGDPVAAAIVEDSAGQSTTLRRSILWALIAFYKSGYFLPTCTHPSPANPQAPGLLFTTINAGPRRGPAMHNT